MSRHDWQSIEAVLARIDAHPIADADELAHMSLPEIEQQLVDLGVDTDAELDELLDQIGSPRLDPLSRLSASDVGQLNLAQVERRLEVEGVDVRAWLSRAGTLIRNARARAPVNEPFVGEARAPLRVPNAAGGRHALPRVSRRQRRRVPQALAASIVIAIIAGATFSILDEPALDVAAPDLAEEAVAVAPTEVEFAADLEKASDRESTQLAQSSANQSAFKRELHPGRQSTDDERLDALQGKVATAALDAARSQPVSPMNSPAKPTSSVAVTPNAAVQPEALASAVAKSVTPQPAFRMPLSPREPIAHARSAPSRVDQAVARARSEPQPGRAMPRVAAAPRAEKKAGEAMSAAGVVREQRLQTGAASEAEETATIVHVLRAGQGLAVSLDGLNLREDDQKALSELFSGLDLRAGASLRLSMHAGTVQAATVQLPQGRAVSAVRDARGVLVLKR